MEACSALKQLSEISSQDNNNKISFLNKDDWYINPPPFVLKDAKLLFNNPSTLLPACILHILGEVPVKGIHFTNLSINITKWSGLTTIQLYFVIFIANCKAFGNSSVEQKIF